MNDLLKEAKQFLSIVEDSTLKDAEIKTLINAGYWNFKEVGLMLTIIKKTVNMIA